jgi:hypothetical protein
MATDGLLVVAMELAFQDAVDGAPTLFLSQLKATVRHLAAALGTRSRRVGALLKCALGCVALLALEIELVAQTTADTADGSGVTGH